MPSLVAPVVELSDVERSQLVAWSMWATSANALAMRSWIVLAASDGLGDTAIAAKLDISVSSARNWRTASCASAWTGCSTSHVRAGRARLPMSRWRR